MALETAPEIPEFSQGSDSSDVKAGAQARLLASAYDDQSFAPPTRETDDTSRGIQVAGPVPAGLMLQLPRLNVEADTYSDNGGEGDAKVHLVGAGDQLRNFNPRKLASIANGDVNTSSPGNRVPRDARIMPGYRVPEHVQCASTVSDWLIESGVLSSRDYQIRVKDMNRVLAAKFGRPEQLSGNFDLSDFPRGTIGFITGVGNSRGGNHIALVERRGNDVFIVHNKNGTVVREDIKDKFYTSSGRPRYNDIRLFRLK